MLGVGTSHLSAGVRRPHALFWEAQTSGGSVHGCPRTSLRSWRLPIVSWPSPVQAYAEVMLAVGTSWTRGGGDTVCTEQLSGVREWKPSVSVGDARDGEQAPFRCPCGTGGATGCKLDPWRMHTGCPEHMVVSRQVGLLSSHGETPAAGDTFTPFKEAGTTHHAAGSTGGCKAQAGAAGLQALGVISHRTHLGSSLGCSPSWGMGPAVA